MHLNLVVDGRSWAALLIFEFMLFALFVVACVEGRPLQLSAMESGTILIEGHAEHGEIELGYTWNKPRRRMFWPAGIWIRPRAGDTMFDVQGPVAAGFRPWLDTKDVVRILFPPGSCRAPSAKTSGGDSRFVRVCVIVQAEVGNRMVWRYRPVMRSNWTSFLALFFALCLWSAVIVYFFRREGRR